MKTITLSQLGLNLKGIVDIFDQFHGFNSTDEKVNKLLQEIKKIDKMVYKVYLETLK